MNSFQVTDIFVYPLQSAENMWLSDAFESYRSGALCTEMKIVFCMYVLQSRFFNFFFFLSPSLWNILDADMPMRRSVH